MTVKMMICARRRPGQTLRRHRAHMKDVHGRLVLDYIASQPEHAPRRYVQNHGFDGAFAAADPAASPLGLGFDGVTEVWFPDLATAKASLETQFYLDRLRPDEPLMVDIGRVVTLPYEETLIKVPPPDRDAFKIFLIFAKEAVVPLDQVTAACAALPEPRGHTRNSALVPGPIAAIEEFWFSDQETAYRFADAYLEKVVSPGGEGCLSASVAMVLAKEIVLHAGQ